MRERLVRLGAILAILVVALPALATEAGVPLVGAALPHPFDLTGRYTPLGLSASQLSAEAVGRPENLSMFTSWLTSDALCDEEPDWCPFITFPIWCDFEQLYFLFVYNTNKTQPVVSRIILKDARGNVVLRDSYSDVPVHGLNAGGFEIGILDPGDYRLVLKVSQVSGDGRATVSQSFWIPVTWCEAAARGKGGR